jgi:hypothetical protein
LVETMGGSYLLRLLIGLREFANAAIPAEMAPEIYLAFSEKKDTAEARKNVIVFIEALNQFYRETDFDTYFRLKDHLYEQALSEIKSKLPRSGFVMAMEKFYRHYFDQYVLLPSLTIPSGMAFGAGSEQHGKTQIINAFGPYAIQQFQAGAILNMGFAGEKHIRELSTHEFGHSFTNPLLDKIPQKLIFETATLFDNKRALPRTSLEIDNKLFI